MLACSIDAANAEQGGAGWLYLHEIAHRTMNDYAFMLATVERATRAASDETSLRALMDVGARLRAGARAHRVLCQPRDGGRARLDNDLERVCASLSAAMQLDRAITLTLSCEPIELDAFQSWQASLIVSELITNAVKHAFAKVETGKVWVAVRIAGGEVRIVVADEGNGSGAIQPGRGARIVNALAKELGGVIWRNHTAQGSIVAVYFPHQPPAAVRRV
jgi:two-component sensor histidine kinase